MHCALSLNDSIVSVLSDDNCLNVFLFPAGSSREDISEVKNCLNNWFAAVFLLRN